MRIPLCRGENLVFDDWQMFKAESDTFMKWAFEKDSLFLAYLKRTLLCLPELRIEETVRNSSIMSWMLLTHGHAGVYSYVTIFIVFN